MACDNGCMSGDRIIHELTDPGFEAEAGGSRIEGSRPRLDELCDGGGDFMRLILASGSPRRAELLTAAGYSFEVRVPDIDESARPGELPAVYVERLAREKAARIARELPGGPDSVVVLAADTAVVIDGELLGKPADDKDAARMLRRLSGRTHLVMTGVAARAGTRCLSLVETTTVAVDALTDEQVAWYVGSGEGQDKAGGYAVQGLASRFVPRIDGSYSNVVGLPLAAVDRLLRQLTQAAGVLASE